MITMCCGHTGASPDRTPARRPDPSGSGRREGFHRLLSRAYHFEGQIAVSIPVSGYPTTSAVHRARAPRMTSSTSSTRRPPRSSVPSPRQAKQTWTRPYARPGPPFRVGHRQCPRNDLRCCIAWHRSSRSTSRSDARRYSIADRSEGTVDAQPGKAALAARTAWSTSASLDAANVPTTSAVAGLTTSMTSSVEPALGEPPM